MGIYKYIKDAWPKQDTRKLLEKWRKEPATIRIEKPTRLDRARSQGYRAKQGILVVRQRVKRGGRMREKPAGGRRPKRATRRKTLKLNYQTVAEQRANKKYPNCEVLNSYFVGKDGNNYWYEVILIDRAHPAILADPFLSKIARQRGRVFRGLTSSAKRTRGLFRKGIGAEKIRPSKSAAWRRKEGR